MDREIFWLPGWQTRPRAEALVRLQWIVAQERWIIDGNFSGTLPLRVAAADTILLLDLPPSLCLMRVIMRRLRDLGRTRPDMAEGCPERFRLTRADREFLARVWKFRRKSLPAILALLQAKPEGARVITLRSMAEVERFIAGIERKIVG